METKDDNFSVAHTLFLAGELGFLIAIPLAVLIVVGVWLDKRFDTLPMFVILAMILAAAISSVAVWRKIKQLF